MNYAIVEASGKQFWIEPGKFYDLNYIDLNPGDKIALVRVLLVNNNGNVSVGYPCLENTSVEATVLGHIQSKKIIRKEESLRLKSVCSSNTSEGEQSEDNDDDSKLFSKAFFNVDYNNNEEFNENVTIHEN